jgi:transcriptional regulator with XRE-family HTH domain
MLVEADSGDDIVYFKNSEVPRAIENGLEKKGYTKYQMAQILGVDRAYISRIAKGERVPSVDMAKRIGILLLIGACFMRTELAHCDAPRRTEYGACRILETRSNK